MKCVVESFGAYLLTDMENLSLVDRSTDNYSCESSISREGFVDHPESSDCAIQKFSTSVCFSPRTKCQLPREVRHQEVKTHYASAAAPPTPVQHEISPSSQEVEIDFSAAYQLDIVSSGDILDLARCAYAEEGKGFDKRIAALRNLVCQHMVIHVAELSCDPDFMELLADGGPVVNDFFLKYVGCPQPTTADTPCHPKLYIDKMRDSGMDPIWPPLCTVSSSLLVTQDAAKKKVPIKFPDSHLSANPLIPGIFIILAANTGDFQAVIALIDSGASLNARDRFGVSYLPFPSDVIYSLPLGGLP
jgi:hypothetical protein